MRFWPLLACAPFLASALIANAARGGVVFIEAEKFKTAGGGEVVAGDRAKAASGLALPSGSRGKRDGVAAGTVTIKDASRYCIWVRWPITSFIGTLAGAPDREVTTSLDGQGEWDGNFDIRFASLQSLHCNAEGSGYVQPCNDCPTGSPHASPLPFLVRTSAREPLLSDPPDMI